MFAMKLKTILVLVIVDTRVTITWLNIIDNYVYNNKNYVIIMLVVIVDPLII